MKLHKLKLALIFLLLFQQSLTANESKSHYEEIFKMANESYANGNYESAKEDYYNILNAEYESAALYFNLGNTYYKTNNIPAAILYYEKAKKLAPDDKDIAFNLELANQYIQDKIEPLPELFLKKWWMGFLHSASVKAWGNVALLLLFASLIFMAVYLFTRSVSVKKVFFSSAVIIFLFSILFFICAFHQKNIITGNNSAIIFSPAVTVQSSPSANSTKLFVLHAGSKVEIKKSMDGWYKIAIADGNVGWLKMENVEII